MLVSTTELGQVCTEYLWRVIFIQQYLIYLSYLGQSPTMTPSPLIPSTTQSTSSPVARVPRNEALNPNWARTVQLLFAFPPRTLEYGHHHLHEGEFPLVLVNAPLVGVLLGELVHHGDLVMTD